MDAFQSGNPGDTAFRVDRYPFYLLNRLVSRYNSIIDARLRAIGLDIPSWRVLIQRMTAAGLVTTTPSAEDARVTSVALAPAGDARLADARRATAPVYEHLVAGLRADEFEQLIALLGRLHDNLEPLAP